MNPMHIQVSDTAEFFIFVGITLAATAYAFWQGWLARGQQEGNEIRAMRLQCDLDHIRLLKEIGQELTRARSEGFELWRDSEKLHGHEKALLCLSCMKEIKDQDASAFRDLRAVTEHN